MPVNEIFSWHIAGPGSIGLLFYYSLHSLSRDSQQSPYMIHRSLTRQFPTFSVETLDHTIEQCPIQWFEGQHKIQRLIITTKSYQVSQCLNQLAPFLEDNCLVVLLHNGLGIQQEMEAAWPNLNFLFATTTEGAWKRSATELIHAGKGDTYIGPSEPTPSLPPHWWPKCSLEQIGVQWQPEILTQLHRKVAINAAINPLTILFECQNGALITHPDRLELLKQLCQETEEVYKEVRIPYQGITESVINVAELTGKNFSSSYQDWKNERQTELAHMNGYIQALAKKHGLKTPTHDTVMSKLSKKAHI